MSASRGVSPFLPFLSLKRIIILSLYKGTGGCSLGVPFIPFCHEGNAKERKGAGGCSFLSHRDHIRNTQKGTKEHLLRNTGCSFLRLRRMT